MGISMQSILALRPLMLNVPELTFIIRIKVTQLVLVFVPKHVAFQMKLTAKGDENWTTSI